MSRNRFFAVAALALPLLLGACSHRIGDGCALNQDCDPLGSRFCDTSAPGGYCTIEGCDNTTCPGEGVCVRFFTERRDEPCDPANLAGSCGRGDRCLCDDDACSAAHCAPESSERRWCQLACKSDRDCRPGYECRATSAGGGEPVPTFDMPLGVPAKFCAPAT